MKAESIFGSVQSYKKNSNGDKEESQTAVIASVAVNGIMCLVKYGTWITTWVVSGNASSVIFSSALDSTCDGINQYINYSWRVDKDGRYPLGPFRMQAVGAIICATVNISVQAMNIQGIIRDIISIYTDKERELQNEAVFEGANLFIFIMLCTGIVLKLALFLWIFRMEGSLNKLLAMDHLLDGIGNTVTIICWSIATAFAKEHGYVDYIGGLLIPTIALITYIPLCRRGSEKAAGRKADASIQKEVEALILDECDQWKSHFEIEEVTVTENGDALAVDIDIDVIEEEKVTAELLIDVQLHIKKILRDLSSYDIDRVDIDFDDETHSSINIQEK